MHLRQLQILQLRRVTYDRVGIKLALYTTQQLLVRVNECRGLLLFTR